jgi:hypothetical protein
MDERDVIKKLTEAAFESPDMPAARSRLKTAIIKASQRKPHFLSGLMAKLVPSVFLVLAVAATTLYVIDNFNDGSKFNKNGGMWSTYSDAQEGGNSEVWPPAAGKAGNSFIMSQPGYGGTKYAARVTGRSGPAFGLNYNYLGFVVRFDANSSCPVCKGADIQKYTGIKFKIKGNLEGGKLFFILPYESSECVPDRVTCKSMTDYADYETDISSSVTADWTTVTLDFRNDLKQPYWTTKNRVFKVDDILKSVHLFKWQYTNGNGKVMDIWINDLVLF